MTSGFKHGDRVVYSPAFLRATGLCNSEEAFMRGTIAAFKEGPHDNTYAAVQFAGGTLRLVNVRNLAPLKETDWIGL